MIGAAGVGKTAFFLYPNLEYACACGMSFLALDTKDDLAARAKAEKYAKILSKTIISPDGDSGSYGQNAFFYDSAEGLLTAAILLLAEFLPPKEIDGQLRERRHIVSVFKLVQDLLEPSEVKGKSRFQVLMSRLPSEHKARWFAGAALNTSEQAMASVLSLFSAGRSRKLTMLPIIQSLAQLEKNYGKEGSEIIQDNCQTTIFGGFAPNSQTADVLSRALGSYTVQSGSVSRSKGESSQSLQMAERALMTPDELKSIPKGEFVVMKTGSHPMRTRLRLFLDWGITFGDPYQTPEHGQRKVYYAGRQELEEAIKNRFLIAADESGKDRSRQQGRSAQRNGMPARQKVQAGQSIVTGSSFTKKQDGPPPAPEGR